MTTKTWELRADPWEKYQNHVAFDRSHVSFLDSSFNFYYSCVNKDHQGWDQLSWMFPWFCNGQPIFARFKAVDDASNNISRKRHQTKQYFKHVIEFIIETWKGGANVNIIWSLLLYLFVYFMWTSQRFLLKRNPLNFSTTICHENSKHLMPAFVETWTKWEEHQLTFLASGCQNLFHTCCSTCVK